MLVKNACISASLKPVDHVEPMVHCKCLVQKVLKVQWGMLRLLFYQASTCLFSVGNGMCFSVTDPSHSYWFGVPVGVKSRCILGKKRKRRLMVGVFHPCREPGPNYFLQLMDFSDTCVHLYDGFKIFEASKNSPQTAKQCKATAKSNFQFEPCGKSTGTSSFRSATRTSRSSNHWRPSGKHLETHQPCPGRSPFVCPCRMPMWIESHHLEMSLITRVPVVDLGSPPHLGSKCRQYQLQRTWVGFHGRNQFLSKGGGVGMWFHLLHPYPPTITTARSEYCYCYCYCARCAKNHVPS